MPQQLSIPLPVAKVPSLRVLVLGGYGQFGERICRICQTEVKRRGLGVQLLVAGRSTSPGFRWITAWLIPESPGRRREPSARTTQEVMSGREFP